MEGGVRGDMKLFSEFQFCFAKASTLSDQGGLLLYLGNWVLVNLSNLSTVCGPYMLSNHWESFVCIHHSVLSFPAKYFAEMWLLLRNTINQIVFVICDKSFTGPPR